MAFPSPSPHPPRCACVSAERLAPLLSRRRVRGASRPLLVPPQSPGGLTPASVPPQSPGFPGSPCWPLPHGCVQEPSSARGEVEPCPEVAGPAQAGLRRRRAARGKQLREGAGKVAHCPPRSGGRGWARKATWAGE